MHTLNIVQKQIKIKIKQIVPAVFLNQELPQEDIGSILCSNSSILSLKEGI